MKTISGDMRPRHWTFTYRVIAQRKGGSRIFSHCTVPHKLLLHCFCMLSACPCCRIKITRCYFSLYFFYEKLETLQYSREAIGKTATKHMEESECNKLKTMRELPCGCAQFGIRPLLESPPAPGHGRMTCCCSARPLFHNRRRRMLPQRTDTNLAAFDGIEDGRFWRSSYRLCRFLVFARQHLCTCRNACEKMNNS